MANDWGKEWKTTKEKFEKLTGKKKPAEKVLGMFRKSSGIEGALKDCDKADVAVADKRGGAAPTEKEMEAYKAAKKKYDSTAATYIKSLDDAMKADKGADPAYANALKLLKADLKAISARMDSFIAGKVAQVEQLSATEMTIKNMMVNINSALKKAKLAYTQVINEPTAANYNAQFPKAARDITQQLANIVKFRAKGQEIPGVPVANPDKEAKALEDWNTNFKKLPDTASPDDVKKAITAFALACKEVSTWMKSKTA